jgi:CHAT domain-containing protein
MRKRSFLLIVNTLLFFLSLSGQCPGRDSIWKKLLYLRSAGNIPLNEKLNELSGYEAKIKGYTCPGDSIQPFLLALMGVVYYQMTDYTNAVNFTRQSISVLEAEGVTSLVNQNRLVKGYFNLSIYYDSLNEVEARNAAIDSSLAIADRFNLMLPNIVYALEKRVKNLSYVGDYQRCIRFAQLGELLTGKYLQGSDSLRVAIFFLNWRIPSLILFGKYDLAEKLLFSKIEACKLAGLKPELGFIYGQIALNYLSKGDFREAEPYFQQAFGYFLDTGDALNCKIILNSLGYIYFRYFHDNGRAMTYYRKATCYISKNPSESKVDSAQSLDAFDGMAMVYLRRKMYDSCFTYLQLAFDQIKPGTSENDLLQMPIDELTSKRDVDVIADLMINKADAYKQKYVEYGDKKVLAEALRLYRICDQFLDRLKTEQSETNSLLFWRKESHRFYEHAIEACVLANEPEEAFYFFEKSHSVLLNDQVDELQSLTAEDMLSLAQAKKKIVTLERDANQERLIDELFTRKQELDRMEKLAKNRSHLRYQNLLDTGYVSLRETRRALLLDHQALLEFFEGDSAVYSLTITADNARMTRIDKADFDSTVNRYVSYISDAALLNRHFAAYAGTAFHLYQLIFEKSPVPKGRIIISPDGHYFPFEALLMNERIDSPRYFLEEHAISYTYSARYLMNKPTTRDAKEIGDFMGVAPVQFPASFHLAALSGSAESLGRIGSDFGDRQNLIEAEASKANFLRDLPAYRLIQLYTHASDSSNNGEPVIYLADSALYLSDLIPEDKPVTQLIVLSACETGNGTLYQGEGVFSFNRGFAALGIPASIVNLWPVDNKATYRLTELFYRFLSGGDSTDVALQKAKKEFLRQASGEERLPYFWAAPVLTGNTALLVKSPSGRRWPWIILVIAAIFLLFFIFRQAIIQSLPIARRWERERRRGRSWGFDSSILSFDHRFADCSEDYLPTLGHLNHFNYANKIIRGNPVAGHQPGCSPPARAKQRWYDDDHGSAYEDNRDAERCNVGHECHAEECGLQTT